MKRERYALPESALDINLPDRRAKRCTPPRAAAPSKPSFSSPIQAEREAWMRAKQAKKKAIQLKRRATAHANLVEALERANETPPPKDTQQRKEYDEAIRLAPIEAAREAQLLGEAEAEIRRRRLSEQGIN